jgi:hypothetical protein
MNMKCPKKTNLWVHLGRLLAFYKQYLHKLIDYTKENRLEILPTNEWWVVTYSVSPAIDLINITFTLLQRRSLLLVQQHAHIQALIGSFIAMFNIKVEQPVVHIVIVVMDYMIFESMHIDVNQIVTHIEDQGSFALPCYELLKVDTQKTVITKIATYAMMLIVSLNGVKVERDNANEGLDLDVPPVLPSVLMKLRHGTFIRKVLDPYREHLAKF